ncbi:MAG TPA: hypothetical protein VJR46_03930 [Candidatus Dormibacteraeota bacterium]|nr:hypothetical protein [Candidatus Dormibacteraeota bacterium]
MLAAIVAVIVLVLVTAGILVMLGPRSVVRRIRSIAVPSGVPQLFEPRRPREAQPAVNPKTQRVLVAAARLASWLRAHGHEEAARDIRNASARMPGNEAAGLYALQTTLRRIRLVNVTEGSSQERVQALVDELRAAVQDRFEQLELLPFRKP